MTSVSLSQSDWLVHIKNFQESGLSRKHYCAKHSLVYHQFQYYYRHHYLKHPHAKKDKARKQSRVFAPIKISPPSSSSATLELKLPNGIGCTLPLSIELKQLKLLVEVLSS